MVLLSWLRRTPRGAVREHRSRLANHCQCKDHVQCDQQDNERGTLVCTPRHRPVRAAVLPRAGTTVCEIIRPVKIIVVMTRNSSSLSI